ncbi:MAG: hypothetical protein GYA33_02615 [Thermogutta sp.]|nr:hypothetical protein [Thermogutta sp.]
MTDPILIYTILAAPGAPWNLNDDPAQDDTQMPWRTVLDTITRRTYWNTGSVLWGGGAATVEEVAARITTALNEGGRFRYEDFIGRSRYVVEADMYGNPGYFDLTAYHNQITGDGAAALANCLDMAWGVAAMSNLLGDSMHVMLLDGPFQTNPVCLVGSDPADPTSWTASAWAFHAVAWRGSDSDSGAVYDACLRFDGDPDASLIDDYLPLNMYYTSYASTLTSGRIMRGGFDMETELLR